MNYAGRIAVVTGAGSGIGRALAVELAGRAAIVAISDVDEQGLGRTAGLCGSNVRPYQLDVADRGAVLQQAEAVVRDLGGVHLVNISSVFGFVGVPAQSAYNAAKFAVRGFTEALRQEMIIARRPVGVHCAHPGGIDTNIARNARTSDSIGRDRDKQARDSHGSRGPRLRTPRRPS